MFIFEFPNANCSVVSVTSTATALNALINTAGSTTVVFPDGLTSVDLFIENGDVRLLYDGNTPTASVGLLLKQGTVHRFRGVPFQQFKLIRTGGSNVAVSVTLGFADVHDAASSAAGGGGSSSGGASTNDESAFTSGSTAGTLAMGVYQSTPDTLSNGQAAAMTVDANRNLKVTLATLLAGEDITNNVLHVVPQPLANSGWTPSSQTALSNTVVSVRSAPATLGGYMFYNPNGSVAYIQVFNVASGSVTLGTTAPTYVIPLPAGAAANIEFSNGIAHGTAISAAATTTPTGSTAPGTALPGFFLYK